MSVYVCVCARLHMINEKTCKYVYVLIVFFFVLELFLLKLGVIVNCNSVPVLL